MIDDEPHTLPYEIQGWDIGHGAFDINIRVNGVHFTIPVSPGVLVNSPRVREVGGFYPQ